MVKVVSECEKARSENKLRQGQNGGLYIIKTSKITGKKYKYYCHKIFTDCVTKSRKRFENAKRHVSHRNYWKKNRIN